MSYLKFGFVPLALLVSCSCSLQYAILRVVTNDPNKGSVSLVILNPETGLHYNEGPTPTDIIITKRSCERDRTISLIVYDKCYPAKYVLFKVTKWVKKKSELKEAINITQVNVKVAEDKDCDFELIKK